MNLECFRDIAWYIQNPGLYRALAYSELEPYSEPSLVYSGPQANSQPSQTSGIEHFTKLMQVLFCTFFKYGKFQPWQDRLQ